MHNFNKKMLVTVSLSLILLNNAFAILPPKYLSVKNFQQCLGSKDMGGWTAWCLPSTKPDLCPIESWQELNSLMGHDRVQDC